MEKNFFRPFMIATFLLAGWDVSAINNYVIEGDPTNPIKGDVGMPGVHKSPKRINPISATYNSCSTLLTVKFPVTSGGKVEIYRNGVKVVNTSAAAGASLSYVLRNYGKGNYTIIVSCGNTVVYNNNVVIKN